MLPLFLPVSTDCLTEEANTAYEMNDTDDSKLEKMGSNREH